MAVKKETGVALSVDAKTSETLNLLDKKIKGLKRVEEAVYKTGGVIEGFPENLKTETKIDRLIMMMGVVEGRSKIYNNGQVKLKIKNAPVYKENGFTEGEYEHDIKLRIDVINYQETLNKLKGYKDKMTSFLSQQEQKELLIEEMNRELSSGIEVEE